MSKGKRGKLWSVVLFASAVTVTSPGAQTLSDDLAGGELLELRVGVSGQVSEVFVAPGERVDVGAMLVKLEPARYQSRLNAAAAVIASLEFQVKLSAQDLERQQELYEEGSLSTVELQFIDFELKQATAALELARAEYQAAKRDLAGAEIAAPVSGEIVAVPLVGQRANTENGSDVLIKMKVDQ